MIDTQFSRRNLDAPDRILLAQKKAPILEKLARKKQVEAGGDRKSEAYKEIAFLQMDKSDLKEKAIQPGETKPEPKEPPKTVHVQKEVAKIAGVSSGTVARFEQVQKKKPLQAVMCLFRRISALSATIKKPLQGHTGRYQCNVWAFCGCNKKAENVQ